MDATTVESDADKLKVHFKSDDQKFRRCCIRTCSRQFQSNVSLTRRVEKLCAFVFLMGATS